MLKWHKVGCYAVAFAAVEQGGGHVGGAVKDGGGDGNGYGNAHVDDGDGGDGDDDDNNDAGKQVSVPASAVSTVQQRRDQKAQSTHWLAAGAKDGKVSLWDIY